MTEQMPQQPQTTPDGDEALDQSSEQAAEQAVQPASAEPEADAVPAEPGPDEDPAGSAAAEQARTPSESVADETPEPAADEGAAEAPAAEPAPADQPAPADEPAPAHEPTPATEEAPTEGTDTQEVATEAASEESPAGDESGTGEAPEATAPAGAQEPVTEEATQEAAPTTEESDAHSAADTPGPATGEGADEAPAEEDAPAGEPAPPTAEPTIDGGGTQESATEDAPEATAAADAQERVTEGEPARPRPGVPTPAMFAARKPAAPRPPASAPPGGTPAGPAGSATGAETTAVQQPPLPPSDSVKHGRVDEDGTVYVTLADGSERAVGSYPGATAEEALAYFARKYDELVASADLLRARLASTDVSSHDARQSLAHLKEQIGEAHVVGDLAALEESVDHLESAVSDRARHEQETRAAAKAAATLEREAIVAQAEELAAADPSRIQWKQSSTRIRELLEEWKSHQRSGPRLDKDVESGLWHRFSAARSGFDKARKAWFAQLDDQHGEAKRIKERLVAEAEQLSTSKDWGATAGAFKRLMQDWKRAGRASRADDDALWERFKAAQDRFFDAKDEVVAAEEAEFTENLKVKEALLAEAEALKIDEANLEHAKSELRRIQDRWESAGKVPRADVRRVEGRLRAVEQQVRDLEDKKWTRSDPELTARAQSMVEQLERQVQGLQADLAAASAAGDDKRVSALESEIATKKLWLDSARGGLS